MIQITNTEMPAESYMILDCILATVLSGINAICRNYSQPNRLFATAQKKSIL